MIYEEPGRQGRAYFVCRWCEISIWVQDPMIALWETFEPVHCFTCRNHQMRFFCRMDGYCKWLCLNCNCAIEQMDPQKHAKITQTIDEVKAEFKAITMKQDIPEATKKGGFFKGVEESKKELGLG